MNLRRRTAAALLPLALVWPSLALAQEEDLAARCQQQAPADASAQEFCARVAQAVEIAQPRLGLSLSGGNPVPGTASVLGKRLGAIPRVSVALRATGVKVDLPPILEQTGGDELDFILPSLNVDGAIGIYSGFSPGPSVGGLGAVDVLASIGTIPVPESEGFADQKPFTWAVGARIGILRESFLVPGLSVSAMYRKLEDVTVGDPELQDDEAFFTSDLTTLSFRAAVSKQLLFFGLAGGLGYDKYSSDLSYGISTPGLTVPRRTVIDFDGFENDRVSAFANVTWSLLILHVVGELGWQEGSDPVPGSDRSRLAVDPESSAWFGSVAIRLAL